MAGHIFLI